MIESLLSNWLFHFIGALGNRGGISLQHRHSLIVDGYNSHVIVEVVMKAMEVGLDDLTLPSHASHILQPFDVGIFAPNKQAFKRYRDARVFCHRGHPTTKQVLVMLISFPLQIALNISNIQRGFCAIGFWPLNSHAIDNFLGPSRQFCQRNICVNIDGDNQQEQMQQNEPTLEYDDSRLEHAQGSMEELEEAKNEGDDDRVLEEIRGAESPHPTSLTIIFILELHRIRNWAQI